MKKRLSIVILSLFGLVCLVAATYLTTQKEFVIVDDGIELYVTGDYETVEEVLAGGNIIVRPEDLIRPSLDSAITPQQGIRIQRAHAVTINQEGESQTLWTLQENLASFIAEAGLVIARTDNVVADGVSVAYGDWWETAVPTKLEIGTFRTIEIRDGERTQTLRTSAKTVGQALQQAGLTIYSADGVQPPSGTWLTDGLTIVVQRSMPVTIDVDGRLLQTRSHHTNPLDVVSEAGIGLMGADYTIPGSDTILQPNDTIQVVRVTEDFRVEDESIPYQTVYQASDQVDIDSRAVLSYGQEGILRRRVRVQYEGGVAVREIIDGEWMVQEPIDEVIGYGTRINVGVVNTEEGPREYWRVVRMRVTSYTASSSGKPPDHPAYGITASGLPAGYGIVAVDRSVVPFRSEVFVPGYGVAFVGDTGGGVRGRWIDLGYDDDAYVPWSGYVDVYYLTPVPPAEDINYLLPTVLP